jgi:hypothetical protein
LRSLSFLPCAKNTSTARVGVTVIAGLAIPQRHSVRHFVVIPISVEMETMYEKTLALKTNPFDPELPDPKGPRDLAGKPLLLDAHPELEDLFCWDLRDLRHCDDDAAEVLFGMAPAKPAVVVNEAILVIRGSRASGKTTLASHFKRRILATFRSDSGAWVLFQPKEGTSDAVGFRDQIKLLETEIKEKVGANPANLFVFLENVPELGFDRVTQLFARLEGHFRVFLMTTTDPNLTQDELDTYEPKIALFETCKMNLADMEAYIRHRIKLFRSPVRQEIEQTSNLFPFGPTAPSRILGQKDVPIRMVNRRLSREIVNHHKQLLANEPELDVARVPASKLPSLLIP